MSERVNSVRRDHTADHREEGIHRELDTNGFGAGIRDHVDGSSFQQLLCFFNRLRQIVTRENNLRNRWKGKETDRGSQTDLEQGIQDDRSHFFLTVGRVIGVNTVHSFGIEFDASFLEGFGQRVEGVHQSLEGTFRSQQARGEIRVVIEESDIQRAYRHEPGQQRAQCLSIQKSEKKRRMNE
jgi:hypothetical protein